MDVAVVLFDGFDNLDAIGPFEVFSHAEAFGADLQIELLSVTDRAVVTSSHGLRVEPDGSLYSPTPTAFSGDGNPDLVVVPGGGWGSRADVGAFAEVERGRLPDAIAELHAAGTMVASVCTGAMIIAAAGLVEGRPAVTHHGALDDLREAGADVVDARVVDDADLVTAGGVTAGIDLALYLVDREFGGETAKAVADEMEYETRGSVYTRKT